MNSRKSESLRHWFVALPFIFYFLTCSRTIGSGAPAMHIGTIMDRVVSTHVDCHNITMITGWLFSHLPFGELAFRLNLVSSFYAALAICAFYFGLLEQFGRRSIAIIGSVLLMISHAMWWHGTILESYATNAFFTAWAILLMVRLTKYERNRDLYLLCAVAGLSIFNHVSMGFLCVGVLVIAIRRMFQHPKQAQIIFWSCAGSALLGLMPWLVVFVRDWLKFESLSFAFNHAFFGPFKGMMLAGTVEKNISEFVLIYLTNFPNILFLAIPPGIILLGRAWGRTSAPFLGMMTQLFLFTLFAFTYQTWNKYSFGQPALVIFCFAGCFALEVMLRFVETRRSRALQAGFALLLAFSVLFPPYMYGKISTWGKNPTGIWARKYGDQHAPNAFRVEEYTANPFKTGFNEYDTFCRLVLAKLPKGALLFDDDGRSFYQFTDYFQKQLGMRPDLNIQVMNSFAYDNIGWGENPQSTAAILRKAYFEDRELFTNSLSFPFSRALTSLPAEERFRFEKYPLDDKHWVYRLVTQKDESRAFLSMRAAHASEFKSIRAPAGAVAQGALINHDLESRNVLFAGRAQITPQNMKGYGNFWMNQDQLFVRGERIGSWIETVLESDSAQTLSLGLGFTTSYDYGIVDVYLNEALIMPGVDLYSPDVFHQYLELPQLRIPEGKNRLIFRISGKNARSTGTVMGLDFIRLKKI